MNEEPKADKRSITSERADLTAKLDKLSNFINTDDYNEIPQADKDLLVNQHKAMTAYQDALGARLSRLQDLEDRGNKHKGTNTE